MLGGRLGRLRALSALCVCPRERLSSLSLSLSLLFFPPRQTDALALALAARSQRQRAAHWGKGELRSARGAPSGAAPHKLTMRATRARLPACAICSAALFWSPTSGARFTCHCSAALPVGMQCGSPLSQTRGAKAPRPRRDAAQGHRRDRIDMSRAVWPSGLRRRLKAPCHKRAWVRSAQVSLLYARRRSCLHSFADNA